MTLSSIAELLRLLAAFGFILLLAPYAAIRQNGAGSAGVYRLGAAFARVALFLEVVMLVLGRFRMTLPGAVLAPYVLWITWSAWWAHRGPTPLRQRVLLRLQTAVEGHLPVFTLRRPRPATIVFGALIALIAAQRASYPLHNLRFRAIETYADALTLQQLARGDEAPAAGRVALLVPLVHFTGLNPGAVIRFSGVLFDTALALVMGLCGYRFGGPLAAYLAAGLGALLPLPQGASIVCLFWVLAVALASKSWPAAAYSAAAAILVDPRPPLLVLALVSFPIALGAVAARLPERPRLALRNLAAVALPLALCLRLEARAPEGPFQYESAARACYRISRQFSTNQWLIVSPSQELAFAYGRGWHLELVDWVREYTTKRAGAPAFAFPFPTPDVFFFIEKRPLDAPPSADSMDPTVLAYHTAPGRASLEFQAAALIAAYARSHSDLRTYYEDDQLVIYWLHQKT